MQLDLTKLIEKLPKTIKSGSQDMGNEKPTSGRKNRSTQEAYPSLGDSSRFVSLPEIVDEEFIRIYRSELDSYVIPYIRAGELGVHAAGSFIDGMASQVFGNDNHFGIFHYLRERNYDGAKESELVRTAERLINRGWRIRKDGASGRYKLFNEEGVLLLDVTGKSEFHKDVSLVSISEENAHIFLESSSAAKISAVAKRADLQADELTERGSLDSLLLYSQDPEIKGYIINYRKLRTLFGNKTGYPIIRKSRTFSDLHSEGFVLSERLSLAKDDRLVMRNSSKEYLLYPVGHEMNQTHVLNQTLLNVVGSRVKSTLLNTVPRVSQQELEEIQELGKVVALLSEYPSGGFLDLSFSETIDMIGRLDKGRESGDVTSSFYQRIVSGLSSVIVTESIILGNRGFSLVSVGVDTVSGNIYSHAGGRCFSEDVEALESLFSSRSMEVSPSIRLSGILSGVFSFQNDSPVMKDYISTFIKYLPREYVSALSSMDLDVSGYSTDFLSVREYISRAIELVLDVVEE